MDESEYQKQLYIALWYLCSDTDYTATTRRDMIEGIVEGPGNHGLLSGVVHERGLQMVEREYEGHPLLEDVIKCLRAISQKDGERTN